VSETKSQRKQHRREAESPEKKKPTNRKVLALRSREEGRKSQTQNLARGSPLEEKQEFILS
jgi:hypothetical protein